MKKLTALIIATMLLMAAFSGSVSAATKVNHQPIQVWVGDQEVKFDAAPVIVQGTTYVEFKALFKALGYSITYDSFTKEITGTSDAGSMTLNTVTGEATVNGVKEELAVQPIIQKGRTLVPVRFIAEATGMNVQWSAAKQTITITPNGPTEDELKELQAFLQEADGYFNENDTEAILGTIYPGSSAEAIFKSQLAADDGKVTTKSTTTLTKVLDWKNDTAVIEVIQVTEKVSGGFYIDNNMIIQEQLRRGSDHHWKFDIIAPQNIEYTNIDQAVSQEADVPADEKASILAVIDKQIKASNDEDVQAYKETFDPSTPGLEEAMAQAKQMFDTYDLRVTLETARIVEYSDHAAVAYVVQKNEKLEGPAYDNNRVAMTVQLLKNAKGEWFIGIGNIIKLDQL